jgi:Conserved TM helix
LSDTAYWLVWLLALPALLGALQMEGLLTPVQAMVTRLLGFLPNLLGAAVVFGVGFLAARIVRQVITGVLTVAGSERLAARLGLSAAVGKDGLAGLVSLIVFVLMLLPVVAATLQPLGLDSVTNPVSRLLDTVTSLIPKLVAAAIIVAVAALVGRVAASVVAAMLAGLGVDNLPLKLGLKGPLRIGGRGPSELAGTLVMFAVLWVAITQACQVLGFAILTDTVARLGEALAKVAAAAGLAFAGLWLATLAENAIAAGALANARAVAVVIKGAILFFTAALALRLAGLPSEIVTIAFGSVVGAVAIGVAIAIGVGGRHVAGRLLERAVASFSRNKGEVPPLQG